MKKIIILDFINEITYISDYDTAIFENFFEFLEAYNKEFGLNISHSNCQWMEVENVNIKIL